MPGQPERPYEPADLLGMPTDEAVRVVAGLAARAAQDVVEVMVRDESIQAWEFVGVFIRHEATGALIRGSTGGGREDVSPEAMADMLEALAAELRAGA